MISLYDKFWEELLIWPFIGRLKFGPEICVESEIDNGKGESST